MSKEPQAGIKGIRAAYMDSVKMLSARAEIVDPDPSEPRDGVEPGRWASKPRISTVPPHCPVQVVGHDGEVTYVVSAAGQLFEVKTWDATTLYKLFAPYGNYLWWAWPRMSKPKTDDAGDVVEPSRINGLEVAEAAQCLINEGARRGMFDPAESHRGRGGWKDARTGDFVWHSGQFLWRVNGRKLEASMPGLDGDVLYTRQPDTIHPWPEPVDFEDSPATKLLDGLKTSNWERPGLDPLLVVGWFMSGFMGAAVDQRPIVFTTGGHGAGKTFLQGILREIFRKVAYTSANSTAAAIYQKLKRDSRPVIIDELESKAGDSRATAVIELARIAYSGDSLDRGGQNHDGVSFICRSAFFLSAINAPAMMPQDKSRMAILNLSRLDKASRARALEKPVHIGMHDGRMLLRQVMDGWREFRDRLLPMWRVGLLKAGMSDRHADTYGTLLACCELAVGPLAMEECGLKVTDPEALAATIMEATEAERAEQVDNWMACIIRLLSSSIEAWRGGEKPTVGGVLEDLMATGQFEPEARQKLACAGVGLIDKGKVCQGYALAVPPTGPALSRIFADTEWHDGVWFNALKQAPADVVLRGKALVVEDGGKAKDRAVVKINGVSQRCLVIDLTRFDEMMSGVDT
ncbi:hypothetical protein [Pleomorphomonas koreensis]|uniref:hypothetical protein n=1 Tax=Pleomorphomonas koreensis TaxID=257440 RepID=UPI00041A4FD7|nr:hypothetical protein [Pleomorphomonas koreensis]